MSEQILTRGFLNTDSRAQYWHLCIGINSPSIIHSGSSFCRYTVILQYLILTAVQSSSPPRHRHNIGGDLSINGKVPLQLSWIWLIRRRRRLIHLSSLCRLFSCRLLLCCLFSWLSPSQNSIPHLMSTQSSKRLQAVHFQTLHKRIVRLGVLVIGLVCILMANIVFSQQREDCTAITLSWARTPEGPSSFWIPSTMFGMLWVLSF